MTRLVECPCFRCGDRIVVHAADGLDPEKLAFFCERCRAKVIAAVIPSARTRASWWRRLIAWFASDDIGVYCSRCCSRLCSSRSPMTKAEAEIHDRICAWCHELEASNADPENRPPPTSLANQSHVRGSSSSW